MIYDQTHTIKQFLEAASAKQPTPGGGSVAALAGALAVSMAEMVVNYSIGKKDLAAHEPQFSSALTELHRARQMLLELMVEDQAAYEAMTAARKLPADAPDRQVRLDGSLLACIRVPQAVTATAAAVLQLCDSLVDRANRYLLSDLSVCAELAMATVRCGAVNVRANIADVPDAAERKRIDDATAQITSHALQLVRRVVPRIEARQRQA